MYNKSPVSMYDTACACTRKCQNMRDANQYEQGARECGMRILGGFREHVMRRNPRAFIVRTGG